MPDESTVKYDGIVADVDSSKGRVYINKGSKDGIKIRDRFVIFSIGKEVFDPLTKESLGIVEDVKIRGEVINVQENLSTIQQDDFRPSGLVDIFSSLGSRDPNSPQIGNYARKLHHLES